MISSLKISTSSVRKWPSWIKTSLKCFKFQEFQQFKHYNPSRSLLWNPQSLHAAMTTLDTFTALYWSCSEHWLCKVHDVTGIGMYSDGTTQSSEITFITVAGVLRSFPTETYKEDGEAIVKRTCTSGRGWYWNLCCLQTPGLGKNVQCHAWLFLDTCNHQIRHQATQ